MSDNINLDATITLPIAAIQTTADLLIENHWMDPTEDSDDLASAIAESLAEEFESEDDPTINHATDGTATIRLTGNRRMTEAADAFDILTKAGAISTVRYVTEDGEQGTWNLGH